MGYYICEGCGEKKFNPNGNRRTQCSNTCRKRVFDRRKKEKNRKKIGKK